MKFLTYTPPDGPLCNTNTHSGPFPGVRGGVHKSYSSSRCLMLKKRRKLKIFNSITDGSAYKIKSVFFPCVFVPVPPPPRLLQQRGIKSKSIIIKGKTLEIEYMTNGMF